MLAHIIEETLQTGLEFLLEEGFKLTEFNRSESKA